jgi:hypothetical protein
MIYRLTLSDLRVANEFSPTLQAGPARIDLDLHRLSNLFGRAMSCAFGV